MILAQATPVSAPQASGPPAYSSTKVGHTCVLQSHSLRLSTIPWAPFTSPCSWSSLISFLVPGFNLGYCWCQVNVPQALDCGGGGSGTQRGGPNTNLLATGRSVEVLPYLSCPGKPHDAALLLSLKKKKINK